MVSSRFLVFLVMAAAGYAAAASSDEPVLRNYELPQTELEAN